MTRITVNAANDYKKNTTVKLLQGAIKREGKILKAGLEKTARNLKDFEKKYSMTSRKFFQLYQNGELDDRNDFVDWSGEYQLYQSLKEQITRNPKS